ncbi:MAG: patatin-like phospholipase family protein [Tenericutes bacterium]|nr:patatin-like phospholipase family protein [Mycoplasmatota bacterium]
MRAIVLSGGGSKGAYQMGVWAALKKLNIHYDIVTGTSVGALNAALMVQKTFYKGLFFWYNLNSKMIFNEDLKQDYHTKEGKKEILKWYAKGVLNGGIEVKGLEDTIRQVIQPKKVLKSNVDMGIVTFNMKTLKPKIVKKKDLNENNLCDYLLASASCFPAFKMKTIEEENYIDGGIYDNLPINLAIDLGATEVIAIDLKEVGFKQKVKNKNIPITYIEPRNDIGSFLIFEKNMSRRAMRLGYNDTLKVMNYLDGVKYTFKKNDLEKNYQKYKEQYQQNIKKILTSKANQTLLDSILKLTIVKRILSPNEMKKEYTNIIENLGEILEIEDSKIYSIAKYNKLLKEEFLKVEKDQTIETFILQNKIKKLLNQKETIKYIYDLLDSKNKKKLYGIILLFPKMFLEAVYLKTIIEK